MQNRSKAISRLFFVLLSIVVLELVLIGNQVQPVKGIERKILVKKLKNILPFMALLKLKKKLILVPIPIPMFTEHNPYNAYPHQQNHHHQLGLPVGLGMMSEQGFMQMTLLDTVALPGSDLGQAADMRQTPVNIPLRPTITVESPALAAPDSVTMTMPSMTTIMNSNGDGQSAATVTAMEMRDGSRLVPQVSDALKSRPPNSHHHYYKAQKQHQWPKELQQQQTWDTSSDYHLSPRLNSHQTLARPAKLLRTNNSRQNTTARPAMVSAEALSSEPPPAPRNQQLATAAGARSQPDRSVYSNLPTIREEPPRQQVPKQPRKQFTAAIPVVMVKNRSPSAGQTAILLSRCATGASGQEWPQPQPQHLSELQTQRILQALDYERLEAIESPRYVRLYQTSDGLYHMTPPPQLQPVRTQATPTPANSECEQGCVNSRRAKGEPRNKNNVGHSEVNSEVSTTTDRRNDGLYGLPRDSHVGADRPLKEEPTLMPSSSITTIATAPQATTQD